MKIGTVTGAVWSSRKATCLAGQTFLVVKVGQEQMVAADARFGREGPVDAAVVAILDAEGK